MKDNKFFVKVTLLIIIFYFNVDLITILAKEDESTSSTQEDLIALQKFPKEIIQPDLTIDQKIEKYKNTFEIFIKNDTPQAYQEDFLSSFIKFVSLALDTKKFTINELERILNLYGCIRKSEKFDLVDREKLLPTFTDESKEISSGKIKIKIDIQKKIKKNLLEALQIENFSAAILRYKDILKSLNKAVNTPYLKEIISALGNLVAVATEKNQKENLKRFLNNLEENRFFSDKQKNKIKEYSNKLKKDLKTIENKAKQEAKAEKKTLAKKTVTLQLKILDQKIKEMERSKKILNKIKIFSGALEFVKNNTSIQQKKRLVKNLVGLFYVRANFKKDELGALKNLFEDVLKNQFLLSENKDPKKNQRAIARAWLRYIIFAYNLTKRSTNYFQSLINIMKEKSIHNKIKICDKLIILINYKTLSSDIDIFVKSIIGFYEKRDNISQDDLKLLKTLFEKGFANKFLNPNLPKKFPSFIKILNSKILKK